MKQTNPFCTEAFSENSNSKKPRNYVARATINLTSERQDAASWLQQPLPARRQSAALAGRNVRPGPHCERVCALALPVQSLRDWDPPLGSWTD